MRLTILKKSAIPLLLLMGGTAWGAEEPAAASFTAAASNCWASRRLGVLAAFAWAFGFGLILFYVIKKTIGLRVTEEEEIRSLDIGEHGMEAYSGFQIFSTE